MSDSFKIAPPPVDPNERHEDRLKRMKMRSMRRGIKEMDLILSAFADAELARMKHAELDVFDALLHENDQELYAWVTGQETPPERFSEIISTIYKSIHKG